MDARTIERYVARAAAATTVRELHATVQALRRAHPDDADADRVERACWDRALELMRYASAPPRPGRGSARPGGDWKEQAARMTLA